jgi:hypothetical protein
VVEGAQERLRKARQALSEAEHSVRAVVGNDAAGFESHPTIQHARRVLAEAESEVARLNAGLASDKAGAGEATLLSRVKLFLAENQTLEPLAEEVDVKPTDTVAALRNERAQKLVERQEVESAPEHSSTIKARIAAQIDELAKRGEVAVSQSGSLRLPTRNVLLPVQSTGVGPSGAVASVGSTHDLSPDFGLIGIWLNKDAITKALQAKVPTANDSRALSESQKRKRLAAIDSEILAIERREVALIEQGGNAVSFRSDTDPRVFLGVQ